MTLNIDTISKRRRSVRLAAGLAISALLAVGTFAAPANADWDGNRGHTTTTGTAGIITPRRWSTARAMARV